MGGGLAVYRGDLSANFIPDSKMLGAHASAAFTRWITPHFSLNAALSQLYIRGSDKYNAQNEQYYRRNLDFETNMVDLALTGRLQLTDQFQSRVVPFLEGGFSVFHFNPYTYIGSKKIFLHPYNTEGQGFSKYPNAKPYQLFQPALVYGTGVFIKIFGNWDLGLELSARYLFTDYLDDVSGVYIDKNDLYAQRGQTAVGLSFRADEIPFNNTVYPQAGDLRGSVTGNDMFYTIGLLLRYRIDEIPIYQRNWNRRTKLNCPVVF
jgi:hypothetical protein